MVDTHLLNNLILLINFILIMIFCYKSDRLMFMTSNQCTPVKNTLVRSAVMLYEGELMLLCEMIFCCVLSGGNCA
jgi:hypothetical protein